MSYPPARIGDAVSEVETPALLLDLDAAERNIVKLQEMTAGTRAVPRPHAKSHKCPNLARLQIAHGAVGVCCQKVNEAVALVDGGVSDVLLSNQVVDAAKLRRLAALARRARIAVCVDQARNVADLSAAAADAGVELAVLVEIEVGMGRCGVAPGTPTVELARQVDTAPNLRFAGLQAYHGSAQHLERAEQRRAGGPGGGRDRERDGGGAGRGRPGVPHGLGQRQRHLPLRRRGGSVHRDSGRLLRGDGRRLRRLRRRLRAQPVPVEPGDERAAPAGGDPGRRPEGVHRRERRAAGGGARRQRLGGLVVRGASDEHSTVDATGAERAPNIGDKLRLIPPHCDPTVNLHDWLVCIRDEVVVDLWPVSGRGPGL